MTFLNFEGGAYILLIEPDLYICFIPKDFASKCFRYFLFLSKKFPYRSGRTLLAPWLLWVGALLGVGVDFLWAAKHTIRKHNQRKMVYRLRNRFLINCVDCWQEILYHNLKCLWHAKQERGLKRRGRREQVQMFFKCSIRRRYKSSKKLSTWLVSLFGRGNYLIGNKNRFKK